MRITHDGSVGIGTTTPHTKLEIKGGPICLHSSIYDATATPSNGVEQEFIAFGGVSGGDNIEYGMYMGLRKPDAVTSGSSVRLQIGQIGRYDTTKAINHADNTDQFTPRLTIMRSGYVGIGTGNDDPSFNLVVSSGDHTIMGIVGGNGTANSSQKNAEIRLLESVTGDYGFSLLYHGSDTNTFRIMGRNHTSGTSTHLTIHRSSGNVGIGTTTPVDLLQVNGGVSITGTGTAYDSSTGDGNGTAEFPYYMKIKSYMSGGSNADQSIIFECYVIS